MRSLGAYLRLRRWRYVRRQRIYSALVGMEDSLWNDPWELAGSMERMMRRVAEVRRQMNALRRRAARGGAEPGLLEKIEEMEREAVFRAFVG